MLIEIEGELILDLHITSIHMDRISKIKAQKN